MTVTTIIIISVTLRCVWLYATETKGTIVVIVNRNQCWLFVGHKMWTMESSVKIRPFGWMPILLFKCSLLLDPPQNEYFCSEDWGGRWVTRGGLNKDTQDHPTRKVLLLYYISLVIWCQDCPPKKIKNIIPANAPKWHGFTVKCQSPLAVKGIMTLVHQEQKCSRYSRTNVLDLIETAVSFPFPIDSQCGFLITMTTVFP